MFSVERISSLSREQQLFNRGAHEGSIFLTIRAMARVALMRKSIRRVCAMREAMLSRERLSKAWFCSGLTANVLIMALSIGISVPRLLHEEICEASCEKVFKRSLFHRLGRVGI